MTDNLYSCSRTINGYVHNVQYDAIDSPWPDFNLNVGELTFSPGSNTLLWPARPNVCPNLNLRNGMFHIT